jgi:hypothetical protein
MFHSKPAHRMSGDQIAKFCRWYLACAALVSVTGCGGPYDASARGMVTLDGKVVPRGMVSFNPVSGGPVAYAMIGEDGHYVVRTGRDEGLPAGDYQVSITAYEAPAVAQTDKGGPPPPGKAITPVWYRMKETSGLKFNVKPGKNEINLELTSKPPAGLKPRGT